MARVGDNEGTLKDGTYLDPGGVRDLVRQLYGVSLLLDDMGGSEGSLVKSAAGFDRGQRITGAGYLVDRNVSTLKETRKAVAEVAGMFDGLLRATVRMVNEHERHDGKAHDDIRDTRD